MPSSPLPAPADGALSDADWYRIVRGQIEFEASLIAQRLSWFVTAQSFLFSAYAITLNAPHESASLEYAQQQKLLFRLVPVVAIASCTLIYFAILGAVLAQVHLRQYLKRRINAGRLAEFPPLQGAQTTRTMGLIAPLGLPIVFVSVWIFLLAHGFQ